MFKKCNGECFNCFEKADKCLECNPSLEYFKLSYEYQSNNFDSAYYKCFLTCPDGFISNSENKTCKLK